MTKKSDLIKKVVKTNVGEKPTFGTDPNDPWSTKAGITEESINETALLNRYLKSRGINPEFVSKDQKVSHSKTNQFKVWMQSHADDPVKESITQDHTPTQKRLGVLKRAIHQHKEIRVADGHKKLHSEESLEEALSWKTIHKEPIPNHPLKAHILVKEPSDKKNVAYMVHHSAKSINDKSNWGTNDRDSAIAHAKRMAAEHGEKKVSEDFFHGSAAAVGMPFDGANNPDDTVPEKRKQPSGTAKVIKSIVKKGIKEDMYDHEKEDKPVASPGKKTKLQKLGIDVTTKQSPPAAAVLQGGTTLTGEPRDTIEIDPMMKMRKQSPDSQKSV